MFHALGLIQCCCTIAQHEVLGHAMMPPLLGMSDHVDGRLAFLQPEFKISPAQRVLWDAFTTAALRLQ